MHSGIYCNAYVPRYEASIPPAPIAYMHRMHLAMGLIYTARFLIGGVAINGYGELLHGY